MRWEADEYARADFLPNKIYSKLDTCYLTWLDSLYLTSIFVKKSQVSMLATILYMCTAKNINIGIDAAPYNWYLREVDIITIIDLIVLVIIRSKIQQAGSVIVPENWQINSHWWNAFDPTSTKSEIQSNPGCYWFLFCIIIEKNRHLFFKPGNRHLKWQSIGIASCVLEALGLYYWNYYSCSNSFWGSYLDALSMGTPTVGEGT